MKKKVVAVRWLGAYRRSGSLTAAGRWELKGERQVAFAFQYPEERVGAATIGLLVDLERSRVTKIYAGDAWTVKVEGSGDLVATRSYSLPVRLDRQTVVGDRREYDEAWGWLRYKGVVVHRYATKRERQRARSLAYELGLPYLGTLK